MTDSTQQPKSRRSRSVIFVVAAFIIGFALLIGIGALLMNINTRKQEAAAPHREDRRHSGRRNRSGRVGPELSARIRSLHDDAEDRHRPTAYGGSVSSTASWIATRR